MSVSVIYAHTKLDRPEAEWELLPDHLERVAARAEEFCTGFAPGFGRALGLLHDIGKYQPKFQAYLRATSRTEEDGSVAASKKEPHAIVGAAWAWGQQAAGMMLALAIRRAQWLPGMLTLLRRQP